MEVKSVMVMVAVIILCRTHQANTEYSGNEDTTSNRTLAEKVKCDRPVRNWDDECEGQEPLPTLCAMRPCLNGRQEVRRIQLCNGIFDCDDLSDECLCDRETDENRETKALCQELFSRNQTSCESCNSAKVESVMENCKEGWKICDNVQDCPSGIDEIFCTGYNQRKGDSESKRMCRKPTFEKVNGDNISVYQCDGIIDLPDGSDEANCSRFFYCKQDQTKITLERNPNLSTTVFGDLPGVYVDWRRTFDGVADCPDISDEWHPYFVYCPEDNVGEVYCRGHIPRKMASAEFALKSRFFAVGEWVIGSIIVIANGAVMTLTSRSLLRTRGSGNNQMIRRVYQALVLNLSLSDFLLGAQMLAIAVSDAVMAGKYWKYDTTWKTSPMCLVIGHLGAILTHVSALTVFAISATRLYTLLRPFSMIRVRYISVIALLIWGIALFVSKIPTMESVPVVEDYFIQAVAVPNLPQVDATVIDRQELNMFVRRAAILSDVFRNRTARLPPVEQMRWKQLEKSIRDINPEFANWKYYGYYSHTSMCIPSILLDWKGYVWEYLFASILTDVFAYSFVIFAYTIVLKRTTGLITRGGIRRKSSGNGSVQPLHAGKQEIVSTDAALREVLTNNSPAPCTLRREKENRGIQRRLSLLVFTDFLCWAPILILNIITIVSPQSRAFISQALIACYILLQLNSMVNPFIYSRKVRRGALYLILAPYNFIFERIRRSRHSSSTIPQGSQNH